MKWYHYIACFFAGIFLTNAIPHFIHGISGDPFPTPFANPPGKGLSSPVLNTIWGAGNMIVGGFLFKVSKLSWNNKLAIFIFFAAVLCMSFISSIVFTDRMR